MAAPQDERMLIRVFERIDHDGNGHLDVNELRQAMLEVGLESSEFDQILRIADANNDGTVDKAEFLSAMGTVSKSNNHLAQLVEKQKGLLQVTMAGGGLHSYSTEEVSAFADHLNNVLGSDPKLAYLMPLDPDSDDLFAKCGDGVILSKFVNLIQPYTIDERAINFPKKKPLSIFKVNENLNLALNACRAVGVRVVNIGAGDMREVSNPSLVLGLMWQMVRMHLMADINLKAHPELIRLLEANETLEDLLKLTPEKILLRWMNYHLKEAGSNRRLRNFGGDVKDSEAYTIVMNRIAPNHADTSALNTQDKNVRATKVLNNARNMGCRPFVKPRDIVSGNEKLNLIFVADLFNTCPGLDPLEEEELEEIEQIGLFDDMDGDSREERAFRMWANTLGIPGDFYINNLFEDFHDGLQLLKVIDAVEPGTVSWRRVEKKPKMIFKKNANNEYAVVLGKGMGFSLVATGGGDITQKNKKLVLGYVWQLMRYHQIKLLQSLSQDGVAISDDYILEWSNSQVISTGGEAASSFRDNSLSTGVYLCYLAGSVYPEAVNWDLVTEGTNDEDALLNCRYAISIARKLACCVFCLPEDLQEVRSKMILTFAAAVMKRVLQGPPEQVANYEFEEDA